MPIVMLALHSDLHLIDAIARSVIPASSWSSTIWVSTTAKTRRRSKELDKLLALAKRPNIAVKASLSATDLATVAYPFRSLHP